MVIPHGQPRTAVFHLQLTTANRQLRPPTHSTIQTFSRHGIFVSFVTSRNGPLHCGRTLCARFDILRIPPPQIGRNHVRVSRLVSIFASFELREVFRNASSHKMRPHYNLFPFQMSIVLLVVQDPFFPLFRNSWIAAFYPGVKPIVSYKRTFSLCNWKYL
jgi:hypothetical protein